MSDPLIIAGREFRSRLFLGTAGYPNRKIMLDSVAASGSEMVTASIRRISLAGRVHRAAMIGVKDFLEAMRTAM